MFKSTDFFSHEAYFIVQTVPWSRRSHSLLFMSIDGFSTFTENELLPLSTLYGGTTFLSVRSMNEDPAGAPVLFYLSACVNLSAAFSIKFYSRHALFSSWARLALLSNVFCRSRLPVKSCVTKWHCIEAQQNIQSRDSRYYSEGQTYEGEQTCR